MGLTLLNIQGRGSHGTLSSAVGISPDAEKAHGTNNVPWLPKPESRVPNPGRRVREAASPALLFGQDPEGYRPIGNWRGFGPSLSPRDLNPPLHTRMQQVAYYLYLVNPLAHRIVEYTKNYVVGDGVNVRAADPAV